MEIKINDQKGSVTIWPVKPNLKIKKTLMKIPDDSLRISLKEKVKSTIAVPVGIYTQHEVDVLLAKRDNSLSSQTLEIEKEIQVANKQKRLDNKTVANLVKRSNRILVNTFAQFPFDFFPDSITVEESRVTITKRHMLSAEVHSVDIKDISNIFINSTIFFSQLVIISKTFEDNEVRIRYLRNKKAIFVRRIIEGLRVFVNKEIETCNYSVPELITKLEELSTTKQ